MTDRQAGRPRAYSHEVAEEVLSRLCAGESLRSICRDDHIPAISTVSLWVVNDEEGFSERYARARRVQALRWADEILEIADDGRNDTYSTDDGSERTDFDVIQRSRLRVDTRKWLLAKMMPKVYGDKQTVEHSGPDGKPIETRDVSDLTDQQLSDRLAQVRNRLLGVMASPNGNGNGTHG